MAGRETVWNAKPAKSCRKPAGGETREKELVTMGLGRRRCVARLDGQQPHQSVNRIQAELSYLLPGESSSFFGLVRAARAASIRAAHEGPGKGEPWHVQSKTTAKNTRPAATAASQDCG